MTSKRKRKTDLTHRRYGVVETLVNNDEVEHHMLKGNKKQLTFGSDKNNCDIFMYWEGEEYAIEKVHAIIYIVDGKKFYIKALAPFVMVDDKELKIDERKRLKDGSGIEIGDHYTYFYTFWIRWEKIKPLTAIADCEEEENDIIDGNNGNKHGIQINDDNEEVEHALVIDMIHYDENDHDYDIGEPFYLSADYEKLFESLYYLFKYYSIIDLSNACTLSYDMRINVIEYIQANSKNLKHTVRKYENISLNTCDEYIGFIQYMDEEAQPEPMDIIINGTKRCVSINYNDNIINVNDINADASKPNDTDVAEFDIDLTK